SQRRLDTGLRASALAVPSDLKLVSHIFLMMEDGRDARPPYETSPKIRSSLIGGPTPEVFSPASRPSSARPGGAAHPVEAAVAAVVVAAATRAAIAPASSPAGHWAAAVGFLRWQSYQPGRRPAAPRCPRPALPVHPPETDCCSGPRAPAAQLLAPSRTLKS